MRSLFKKPRVEQMVKELNIVQETLTAKTFIFFDLIWYSIIFTLLLTSGTSLKWGITIFISTYVLFSLIYLILYKLTERDSSDS